MDGTNIARELVVALSVTFMFWVSAVAYGSSQLVIGHWKKFRTWRQQDRRTRVNMALWMGIPLLMLGLLWMRGIAIWHYLEVYYVPLFSLFQMLIYLPMLLVALALKLWYICDSAYGPVKGDIVWRRIMSAGAGLAIATFLFEVFA